jgi:ABC-2 type transport system ATP-binding protein
LTAPAIECRSLGKRYGDLAAVDDLSFRVEAGTVTGFVGHNGAGKTTTLRMLLGLADPTAGEAYLLGVAGGARDRSHLARVGYLPENPSFYKWMRPGEFLAFVGHTLDMDGKRARDRAAEALELFGLASKARRKIAGFSKGERQRLGLAQAMMGEPELLILDEPTSGLDPLGRHELLSLIAGISGEKTIFLSSHILEDVEKVCGQVVMIRGGRLIEAGTLREVVDRHTAPGFGIRVREEGEGAAGLARTLAGEAWAGRVERDGDRVLLVEPDMLRAERELPRVIAGLGLSLVALERSGGSLEDVYLKLSEGADEG